MLTVNHFPTPPRTALTGVALLGSTTAKTSNRLLLWNIVYMSNASVSLETTIRMLAIFKIFKKSS